MFEEKIQVKVTKTARLIHLKSEIKTNSKLLIALHGYGQLSTYFSKKFQKVNANFDVLIPEGLHRFYLKGSSGRVGASWMTKEERETDILDNQNYLAQLIAHFSSYYSSIYLLGFSQGGATASRFCYKFPQKIKGLILWGSVFPSDISQDETNNFDGPKYFVLGDQDEYFMNESKNEVLTLQANLGFQTVLFSGGHDLDSLVLNQILKKISE